LRLSDLVCSIWLERIEDSVFVVLGILAIVFDLFALLAIVFDLFGILCSDATLKLL